MNNLVKPLSIGGIRVSKVNNVWMLRRKHLLLAVGIIILIAAAILYGGRDQLTAVTGKPLKERTIHMVTGEFKTKLPDGKEIEAYRWDPGTVFVEKGESIKLIIYGVNGEGHPFIIEGTNIKGEVTKGKETIVPFKAEKEGVYRIICLTHPDAAHNGPMIGYIVVD